MVLPTWIPAALAFLEAHSDVAVVCGRRRERHPEASIYNLLCDIEWNTEVGEAKACGGDAMMRVDAFRKVGGFRESLIAGEEPELCVRIRAAGWKVYRLDQEMTLHDAAMTRFSQWWKRSVRAGYAFAEGAYLHGGPPERHWVRESRRALFWGAALPLVIVVAALAVGPAALMLALVYPAQVFGSPSGSVVRWRSASPGQRSWCSESSQRAWGASSSRCAACAAVRST